MTIITDPANQATQPSFTTVPFIFGGVDLDDLDIADPEVVSRELERIDIGHAGPLFGRYLRVQAPDLVEWAVGLHRLADRVITAICDARDEALDAERHDCWCGTRLEPDEVTCGASRCERAELLNEQGRL